MLYETIRETETELLFQLDGRARGEERASLVIISKLICARVGKEESLNTLVSRVSGFQRVIELE